MVLVLQNHLVSFMELMWTTVPMAALRLDNDALISAFSLRRDALSCARLARAAWMLPRV
jgi:hypothetical protein